MEERKEIVAELLKNGATMVKNLKVKNVTVTPQENYVRLGLTLDKPVKGYVSEDSGNTYDEGEVKVIFVSLYAITALLKDDDNVAFAVNHMIENPNSMSVILSRATIDIIQEKVAKGVEYTNPFSNSKNSTVLDHDTIVSHVIDIKLSDIAIRKVDKIADSLLGI